MNEIKCIKITEIYITSKIFYLLVYIFAAWESDAQNHLVMPLLKMLRDSVVRKSFGRSFFELFPNQRIIFGCSDDERTSERANERTSERMNETDTCVRLGHSPYSARSSYSVSLFYT